MAAIKRAPLDKPQLKRYQVRAHIYQVNQLNSLPPSYLCIYLSSMILLSYLFIHLFIYPFYLFNTSTKQARDLPSGDEDAASDPFCIVRVGKVSQKTKVINRTTFPLWYQTLVFDVELPQPLSSAADISVMVYDWDKFTKNDFLGRFSLPVGKVGPEFQEQPRWFPIYVRDPSLTEGEVLASFQL